MAFSRKNIPKRVIALARGQINREMEFDVTQMYNETKRDYEFRSACESVNQELIGRFKNAVPLTEENACENMTDKIICMRIIQSKYEDFYFMERKFFVKAKNAIGLVCWYEITADKINMCWRLGKSRFYKVRYIGRDIKIPMSEIKIKDFYYKL